MNDNNAPHDNDSAGAYVLDALEPEERVSFESHLRTCESCRLEVAELRAVVDVLPLAVDTVEPPSALKGRIIDAITDEGQARPVLTALPGGVPARERVRRPRITRFEAALGLVAAVIIAGLGIWNAQLQNQINGQKNGVAYQQNINRAILSGAAVTQLAATTHSSAQAALVQPKNGGSPYLIVGNLPPTPSNKVYELWYMRGSSPTGVKVFTYSGSEAVVVPLTKPTTSYTNAAITLERGPNGSPKPTTSPIVLGTLHA